MDLHLFRAFLAVYRTGSAAAAGRLLPAGEDEVAGAVRELAGHVGRPLFENHDGLLVPTAYADALAREAGPPLDSLRTLMARVETEHAGIGDAPVRLAGPREYLAARVLPELADLVAAGLRLGLPAAPADALLEELTDERLDLVVVEGRLRRRGVLARPLGGEELLLVAAPSWARRLRPAIATRLPALAGVPLLGTASSRTAGALRPSTSDREMVPAAGLPAGAGRGTGAEDDVEIYWDAVFGVAPPRPYALTCADRGALGAAVVAGAGVTVLPGHLCADHVRRGELVVLYEPEPAPVERYSLVMRTGPATPAVATVRDRLLTRLGTA